MENEEKQYPEPQVRTSKAALTVWILPLVALILAVFLIYKNINEQGISVFVEFPDANGIVAKKTPIKFRGIEVGRVRSLTALQDGSGILANIEMQKDTEPYLTDKLKFWLVKPNVGFAGISGLDTLLSGAYIQVEGGQEVLDGNATRYFQALVGAPPVTIPKELEVFTLVTNNASGVTNGSLIYHRNIVVGKVQNVKLSDDHQAVEVTIAVQPEFKGLVKMNSRFWSISGMKASFDLSGAKVQTGGFVPMLVGGVAFSSPAKSPAAAEYTEFRLYTDADAARDSLEITLTFSSDAPVGVGTAIMLDKQKVGAIDDLEWDDKFEFLTAHAKLSLDITSLMRQDTQFWLESPGLSMDSVNVGDLLRGTIVRLSPGVIPAKTPVRKFEVLNESPYVRFAKQGLHLTFTAEDVPGINKGSGIYYKSEVIGQVQWVEFNPYEQRFIIDALVFDRYASMLNEKSLFYNLSGIEFSAQLQGVKMSLPSLSQLINGGIGVHIERGDFADLTEKSTLPLFKNLHEALAEHETSKPTFTLQSKDLLSPRVNSPVYFKQFEIGKVQKVSLAQGATHSTILIAIEPKYLSLVKNNSRFWLKSMVDMSADISGVKVSAAPLMSMLTGGIEMNIDPSNGQTAEQGHVFELHKDQQSALQKHYEITLTITRNTTLKKGAAVKYRGHTVGEVMDIGLLGDLSGIKAKVRLNGEYADNFIRADSVYWLVQPKVRLNGVQNIAATVFGDHLGVEKGSGEIQDHFVVNRSNLYSSDGLPIVLQAKQLGSLDPGDPVLYKQLRVGEVTDVVLASDAAGLDVNVVIYSDYRHLITNGSKFWNAGGVKVDAGLFSGIKIDTQTFESILAGGIALAHAPQGSQVEAGKSFALHDEAQPDWLNGLLGDRATEN